MFEPPPPPPATEFVAADIVDAVIEADMAADAATPPLPPHRLGCGVLE